MERPKRPTFFVVSDGRGDTCNQLLDAALVQYAQERFDVVRWPEVRTPAQVDAVIKAASDVGATVFYTLVSPETRREIKQRADQLMVPILDVLGPAVTALHDVFKSDPARTPGLFYASERERFDLHAAIDYTLKHDDGQRSATWHLADVVIVGVSRASKSTTCFTLAYRGVKAANVPLIPTAPPSRELLELDKRKVIGLRVNVSRLMSVREARAAHLGMAHTGYYVDKREVAREVRHANNMMDENGWRSFDVSYMAVEEIAREVMRLRDAD